MYMKQLQLHISSPKVSMVVNKIGCGVLDLGATNNGKVLEHLFELDTPT